MDREGFRNRLNQYKKAREENPGLKYWEWKDIPKYDEGTDEVRDNTYVAPIEKEQVFIPATGATKLKQDIQRNLTRNGQIKSGAVDIVSPEFEILTVAAGPVKKATSKLLQNAANKIDDSLKYSGRFSQPSTNDKLYEIYNSKLANIGSFEDYKNYVATIFPDSKLKDVYYHGGAKNIKQFKDFGDAVTTSNVGAKHGIYFTPQKEYAQHTRGQRVLSVDADNKQRSIISSLKTRYTPGKLDKLIEDETELYEVLLNSQNPLITKGNWTWAIDDKKYGELLEKGYDAVENKGQSLFQNINRLPETIVWDTQNIHILGNTEDIAGFEKYLKGYANGGEVEPDPLEVLERSRPRVAGIPINDRPLSGTDPIGEAVMWGLGGGAASAALRSMFPTYGATAGWLAFGDNNKDNMLVVPNNPVKNTTPIETGLLNKEVRQYYADDVLPRDILTSEADKLRFLNTDKNFEYDLYPSGYFNGNVAGHYDLYADKIRLNGGYAANKDLLDNVMAHEVNHRYNREFPLDKEHNRILNRAYTVEPDLDTPAARAARKPSEKRATNVNIRHRLQTDLRNTLGHNPTKAEMDKFIDSLSDQELLDRLGSASSYGSAYLMSIEDRADLVKQPADQYKKARTTALRKALKRIAMNENKNDNNQNYA